MSDKKSLKKIVFDYMNDHPLIGHRRLCKALKDESSRGVTRYWYNWKEDIEPIRWLYNFMTKKWSPKGKLTEKEKAHLKRIEKRIGI